MTAKKQVLPLPSFYDPSRAEELRMVDYMSVFEAARKWRAQYGIPNSATDKARIALFGIDNQITFLHPNGQLPVENAIADSRRFAELIYRYLPWLTSIYMTLDTHTMWQIFHPVMLIDKDGNHPQVGAPIPNEEIQSEKWRVNPEAAYAIFRDPNKLGELQLYLKHYSQSLADGNSKYPLIPWPFHSPLGGVAHALLPLIEEACWFHNFCRGDQTQFAVKGGQPLTEAYSPLGEEVTVDHRGRAIGSRNTKLIETAFNFDAVIIGGQAKSHCVRSFIQDLLNWVLVKDPELAKKVYLVEDLTSPVIIPGVVDFTSEATEAFENFRAAGMNLVSTTTPMEQWPGMAELMAR